MDSFPTLDLEKRLVKALKNFMRRDKENKIKFCNII